MATITVTPGHTYGATDTVTSTNLNDLGSPTAALTAGSILTADIADANVTTAKIDDDAVTPAKLSQPLTLETAQASTSGTSIDFTGIPSWVKRVTVIFADMSLSGSSSVLIQLGDSGGVETTGYVSSANFLQGGVNSGSTSSTNGLILFANNAANALTGTVSLLNLSANHWVGTGTWNYSNLTLHNGWTAGDKTLSDTLTQLRITTVNGTDTFDAGSINIMYE
jgi:hypothetical protein